MLVAMSHVESIKEPCDSSDFSFSLSRCCWAAREPINSAAGTTVILLSKGATPCERSVGKVTCSELIPVSFGQLLAIPVDKVVKLYRRETWDGQFDLSDTFITQVGT